MHAVAEEPEEGQQSKQRKLLVAIDDNRACEDAVDWALKEFYSQGAPPVDFLPTRRSYEVSSHEEGVKRAQEFFKSRFLPRLQKQDVQHKLHILEGGHDADSIGDVISCKALELGVVVVIMASQGKSKFQQFFLGSTTAFVSKSCKVPVLIVH